MNPATAITVIILLLTSYQPILSLSCIFELFPGLLEADPVCVAYLLAELAHLRICGKAKETGTQNCRVYCNVYFYYYSRITTREAIWKRLLWQVLNKGTSSQKLTVHSLQENKRRHPRIWRIWQIHSLMLLALLSSSVTACAIVLTVPYVQYIARSPCTSWIRRPDLP